MSQKAIKQQIEASDEELVHFLLALTKMPYRCPKCNLNLLATKKEDKIAGYCINCKEIYELPEGD